MLIDLLEIRVAAADGKAIQDRAAVRARTTRVVEHVKAILIVIGEIRPIVAIQVAAEDGHMVHPVTLLPRVVEQPRFESAIDAHAVLQLERPQAVVTHSVFLAPMFHRRPVRPRRHPDLVAGHSHIQGGLQLQEGIPPGCAVLGALDCVGVDIDDGSPRLRALSSGGEQGQCRCQNDHAKPGDK